MFFSIWKTWLRGYAVIDILQMYIFSTSTLVYQISVGVRLLIYPRFSTQHALVPYYTCITFHLLLFIIKYTNSFQSNFNIFCIFSAFFGLKASVWCGLKCKLLLILMKLSTLYEYIIPFVYCYVGQFPPNIIIPYCTEIW